MNLETILNDLSRKPADPALNLAAARLYQAAGEHPAAIRHLEKLVQSSPRDAEAFFLMALSQQSLNDRPGAQRSLRQALEIEPDNGRYLHALALLLKTTDQAGAALETMLRAVSLNPGQAEILNDLGVLYYEKGQAAQAEESIRTALSLEPGYQQARLNLLQVLLSLGKLNEAENILRELNTATQATTTSDLTFSGKLLEIDPLAMIKNFDEASGTVNLSIVVPVFNEAANLPILHAEINRALANLKEDYEIIYIDDGSTDGSREALEAIARLDSATRIIEFRRNYGQTAALTAGFKYARGSVVVSMDGDLQNDPADIPRLLEKMAEGYDLVSGWRSDRQDKQLTRVIPSKVANGLINRLISATGVQLHDYGCTLKAYKRGIIKNINLYGEMHRFIPCFAAWLGVKVTEIPVNHRPRVHGQAKYGLSRVPRVIFDLLVVRFFADYMTRPIQFFGKIARKLGGFGLLAIVLLAVLGIFTPVKLSLDAILILLAILMVAVLQIISLGLLGEIMVRSYFETQKKDCYIVEKVIN